MRRVFGLLGQHLRGCVGSDHWRGFGVFGVVAGKYIPSLPNLFHHI